MRRWLLWLKQWIPFSTCLQNIGCWLFAMPLSYGNTLASSASVYLPQNLYLQGLAHSSLLPSATLKGWLDWNPSSLALCRGNLQSAGGAVKLSLPLSFHQEGFRSHLRMELRQQGSFAKQGLLASLCQGPSYELGNGVVFKQVADWLREWYPDHVCTAQSGEGWRCRHRRDDGLAQSRLRLKTLENLILKRWVRQPYLVLRHLAVMQQVLAEVKPIVPARSHRGGASFCKNVAHVGIEELPLALADKTWQNNYCDPVNKDSAASIAAEAALEVVAQLDHLVELSAKVSISGRFRLSLPSEVTSKLDHSGFWVKLEPSSDVVDNIWRQSAQIWQNKRAAAAPTLPVGLFVRATCPRPFMSEKVGALSELWQGRREFESGCTYNLSPALVETTKTFQANMLMGEQEFFIGNLNHKILRLPAGTYRYQIHAVPRSSSRWYPESWRLPAVTSGELVWQVGKGKFRTVYR
ncbi:MAG: hypothetical protein OXT67_00060 [Zetaproteobacteria bacterium]|nr:hypothetical protein [Zetaproteobacteria bacterium]